jgi:hypothetical protein
LNGFALRQTLRSTPASIVPMVSITTVSLFELVASQPPTESRTVTSYKPESAMVKMPVALDTVFTEPNLRKVTNKPGAGKEPTVSDVVSVTDPP